MHSAITSSEVVEETQPHQRGVQLAVTAGLSVGAKLRDTRLFTLENYGVTFLGEMSFEQWREGMRALSMTRKSYHYWLAAFVREGKRRFTQEQVEGAMVQLEFTSFDVDRALAICDLPEWARDGRLSVEHCWVLAKSPLEAPAQERWMKAAIDESLTPIELVNSIAAGKVLKAAASGRGFATIEGFHQNFASWWARVDKVDPVTAWSRERKQVLFDELLPSVQLGINLASELGITLEAARVRENLPRILPPVAASS
ncbi:MAG: hypothetical protein QOE70_4061 [Chthoniobacter sp.]|jgi:hypothetical protein|nr:hypothetical protein [Chthoniobacter sp.]